MGVRGDECDAGTSLILKMALLTGFLLVLLAGVLQGTFVLPMTLVRGWKWEHTWATFSLLGMLVFNWLVVVALVPNIFAVYAAAPRRDLAILALFGAGWGLGAVGVCPVVKRIWTPTWTLYSGGWCFLLLAGFYAATDVTQWVPFLLTSSI